MQQMRPFSITAPGFAGLNTQDAPVDMDGRFALEASNCLIDKFGRVGSRKGWEFANTSNVDLGSSNIEAIGELVEGDGTLTIIAAGNNKLFRLSAGTLTTLTYGGGGSAPTITANKWQMAVLNGVLLLFQVGHDPLIYDPAISNTIYRRISEVAGHSGTTPSANCVISAFGRVWVAGTTTDKNTITWTDTLTYNKWTGGTAGTLNLHGVWPQGGDTVVALGQHNGRLIIFGTKQILIYDGPANPATMTLADSISSTGCSGRDTVANTAEDLIFLSPTGVRTLNRTIQEKSAPVTNLSRNVNDDIIGYIINEDDDSTIISTYSPIDSFYLLTFVRSKVTYCFDMRTVLPDGSARVTTWTLIPNAYCYSLTKNLYMGVAAGVARYNTYFDNGVTYRMAYYSSWIDFGDPVRTSILKRVGMTLFGVAGQDVVYKWGFDYITNVDYQMEALDAVGQLSEYNIAEYGIGEYTGGTVIQSLSMPATGSGKVVQVGIEVQLEGYPISVQRVDIYTKDGRY